LRQHRGNSEVRLHVRKERQLSVLSLPVDLRVNPTPALFGDLKVLLGPTCLDA
jgi:DNA polymerase-3 subunit alpha